MKEEPQPQARRPLNPKEEPQAQARRPLFLGSLVLDLGCLLAGAALLSALAWWWWRPDELFLVLLCLIAVRLWLAPVAIPAWRPRRVLAVGILAYAAVFSFITVTRHLTLLTHALDLGYYVQLTWNLARGAGPLVSLPEMNAWGDHFSPVMYLLAPLFWVAPGAVALLVAQAVALAVGALAVFGIAARRLGDERPAAVFALLYLVNPSLHGINVRDFHSAALAIPLLLAAIYFAERDINAAMRSPFDAVWWGISTMTTVGYGDVVPMTAEGRIAASALMLLGIGLFSAVTAVTTSFLVTDRGHGANDPLSDLERLVVLRQDGTLSQAEFDSKRAAFVARI